MKRKNIYRGFILATTTLIMNACSGHTPAVMGVLAPAGVVMDGISRANHNRDIKEIRDYLVPNYDALKKEIKQGEGQHLEALILLVLKKKNNIPLFKQKMQKGYGSLFERGRSIVMRIDRIAAISSNRQGMLPSSKARQVLQKIESDYEGFRLAVKNKEQRYFTDLANILLVPKEKHGAFYAALFKDYDNLYVTSVAVRIFQILKTK